MERIYNLELTDSEIAVMDYLDYKKIFFEPQVELGKRIGYSREQTNKAIQELLSKKLICVLRGKHLNKKLRLITLSGNCLEVSK